jgi:hypothetical protein
LSDLRQSESCRAQQADEASVKASIGAVIEVLDSQIGAIQHAIDALIANDPILTEKGQPPALLQRRRPEERSDESTFRAIAVKSANSVRVAALALLEAGTKPSDKLRGEFGEGNVLPVSLAAITKARVHPVLHGVPRDADRAAAGRGKPRSTSCGTNDAALN